MKYQEKNMPFAVEDSCPHNFTGNTHTSAFLTNRLPGSKQSGAEDEHTLSVSMVDTEELKSLGTAVDYHAGRRVDDLRNFLHYTRYLGRKEVPLMLDVELPKDEQEDLPPRLKDFMLHATKCAAQFSNRENILACVVTRKPVLTSDGGLAQTEDRHRIYLADYGRDFEYSAVPIYTDIYTTGSNAKMSLRQFVGCLATMQAAGVKVVFDSDYEPDNLPLQPGFLGAVADDPKYLKVWRTRLTFQQRLWMTVLTNTSEDMAAMAAARARRAV